jgi:hypothetical protein
MTLEDAAWNHFKSLKTKPARNERPHFDVFVETGRKRGRKAEGLPAAVLPAAEPDRPLGDDVDRDGLKTMHHAGNP